MTPEHGSFGLPGEFLIGSDGRIVASKYGTHAADQWSVDEVLAIARAHQQAPSSPAASTVFVDPQALSA
jgi:hypothetical protein